MTDKGFYTLNIPEKPIACVLIIHGMNEHKERYYPFMEFLGEKGFMTVTADNAGHGSNISSPHSLGYIAGSRPDKVLLNNSLRLCRAIKKRFPDMPLFVIGHSMGSLIARILLEYDSIIDGVVLVGMPCVSKLAPFAELLTAELERHLSPEYRSNIIRDWSEKFLNRNFEDIPHSWICSDPEIVRIFNNDPLCDFTYTLSGYQALTGLVQRAELISQAENPHIPVRLISGKDDPCMLSKESFYDSIKSLKKSGYKNITHKIYRGMRHEVLNEKNKIAVWKDISKNMKSWTERKRYHGYKQNHSK